jgi:hypothetical protein
LLAPAEKETEGYHHCEQGQGPKGKRCSARNEGISMPFEYFLDRVAHGGPRGSRLPRSVHHEVTRWALGHDERGQCNGYEGAEGRHLQLAEHPEVQRRSKDGQQEHQCQGAE